MKEIKLFDKVGSFAENKDFAREIRIKEIIPTLNDNKKLIIDFKGIETATQSFIHALISDLFRKFGDVVLDNITFKSCSKNVSDIIRIVTNYMQERD